MSHLYICFVENKKDVSGFFFVGKVHYLGIWTNWGIMYIQYCTIFGLYISPDKTGYQKNIYYYFMKTYVAGTH